MTNYEFLKQNEVKGLVTCKDTKTGSECIVHSILAEYFNEAEKAVKVYSESQGTLMSGYLSLTLDLPI